MVLYEITENSKRDMQLNKSHTLPSVILQTTMNAKFFSIENYGQRNIFSANPKYIIHCNNMTMIEEVKFIYIHTVC